MIPNAAQNNTTCHKTPQNGGKNDQIGGNCGQIRAKNECSLGNGNVGQRLNRNGGQNGREISFNERENTNPNILDQLTVSGHLMIVIILFYNDSDYVIFVVIQ